VSVLGVASWWLTKPSEPASVPDSSGAPPIRRLTTRAGFNGQPAMSPDGRSVAYVSDRTGSLEIYITGVVATGTERAATSNGGQNLQPDWSPDGQWIAFHSRKSGGIWVVPADGGQPRQLAVSGSNPSWAPDSERLVFTSDSGGFAGQATLWTVRRDGSELKPLTRPGQAPGGAVAPVWSHNGKLVAFANVFGGGTTEPGLFVLSIADDTVRQIQTGPWQGEARFGPRDDVLYWFGLTESRNTAIRCVPINPDTGEARRPVSTFRPLDGIGEGLSINRDGLAAFGIAVDDDNLWALEMTAAGEAGEPVRLTNDTVRNNHPEYSRTGRIAFQRSVPGTAVQSWIMGEDGSNAEVLLPGTQVTNPMWSADGSRLFVLQGDKALWVDLATRRTTEIPIPVSAIRPAFPKLAPDDSALAYHRIESNGQMHVWVQPLSGGPERRVATDSEGVGFPIWSRDGRVLAVEMRRGEHAFIGVVPADGAGPIREIVTERGNSWPDSWSPDNQRIAYAGERGGVWNIWEVDVATKVSRPLTRFTLPIGYVRYPQWSPNGRRVAFERAIRSASVWTMTVK
jgi:Tol biopolymer transport system component